MIIQVTGSRHATMHSHRATIRRTLAWVAGAQAGNVSTDHEIRDGQAAGADEICHIVGHEDFGWRFKRFAADWPTCELDWRDPMKGTFPCRRRGHRMHRAGGVEYCPFAGHRRNQEMIDDLAAQDGRKICVAFPIPRLKSTGTTDCLLRAVAMEIPVFVLPLFPPSKATLLT